jgi:acetyltransferase-like isoleucine patch superfamily enzyme
MIIGGRVIPDSLKWKFYRRFVIQQQVTGFKADLDTYANGECVFSDYVSLQRGSRIFSSKLGRATYIAGAQLSNVEVGAFSSIGPGVRIGLGIHPIDRISTHPAFYSGARQTNLSLWKDSEFGESKLICIGSDVWIGANSLVMGGVKIGDGSVIGAGSVVTKDVPSYAVVAGIPAKHLRWRFSDEQINLLEELKWWSLPISSIRRVAELTNGGKDLNPELLQELMKCPQAS